ASILSQTHVHPRIYTLSLHDALPISFFDKPVVGTARVDHDGRREGPGPVHHVSIVDALERLLSVGARLVIDAVPGAVFSAVVRRSEEHTSELQSPYDLVCRLLLEKKK